MSDQSEHLRARIAKIPTKPGVYRWLDHEGTTLYIGKAKNLRHRMRSYVGPKATADKSPWKRALCEKIADFETTITGSEIEALILETNLIKDQKPKYNVLMKDDKNYVYIRIALHENYPSISVIRKIEKDGAKYFGPYLSKWQVYNMLSLLHLILGYRACKESVEALNKGKTPSKPCLEYQIGECNGLCCAEISQEDYRTNFNKIVKFLTGDTAGIEKELQQSMQDAATNKQFEKAAKLRDGISFIEKLKLDQIVSDTSLDHTDYIGIARREKSAAVVVLREREGKIILERSYMLSGPTESNQDLLTQFLPQYYGETYDIPRKICISENIEEADVLQEWFSDTADKRIMIHAPERGKKSKLLKMAEVNAEEKLKQTEASFEADKRAREEAMEELKTNLHLPNLPKRIEAYDISHMGGTETVGSMVVMKHARPSNKDYRHFTIQGLQPGEVDDYRSLQEVLRRRLRYLEEDPKKALEREGLKFSKAKKSEVTNLKLEKFDGTLYLLKKEEETLGHIGVRQLSEDHYFLCHIKSDTSHLLLIKLTLTKLKQGKVYIASDAEELLQLGFQEIKDVPNELRECHPEATRGATVLMTELHKQKPDTSFRETPDLILIDGGKGQVSAIEKVMNDSGLQIPFAGLAKRHEEIFLPGETVSIELAEGSPGQLLVRRARDEAHRFANRLREKKGAKKMLGA